MTNTAPHPRWGLIIARERGLLTSEPYWTAVADAVDSQLDATGVTFFLRQVSSMAQELDAYREWASSGFVTGVILVNLVEEDPRPALVAGLGLGCLRVGVEVPEPGTASIVSANADTSHDVLERLHALGHRRVGRVCGPEGLAHTKIRTQTFAATAQRLGQDLSLAEGDYSARAGRLATEHLLSGPEGTRPTVLIYDNDTMALAGMEAAQALGLDVPADVSVVAWDDSPLCELAQPPMSAIASDLRQLGVLIARCVLRVESGETSFAVPEPEHHWIQRASVAEVHNSTR